MRRRFPADRSRPAGSRAYSGHGVAAARGYAGVTQLVYERGASAVIANDIDDFEALAEGRIPGARRHVRPCWGSTRGAPATPVRAEAVSVATGARGANSRFSLLRSSRACARLVFSRMAPGRVANPDPSDSLRVPARLIRDHVLLNEATPGPLGVHRRLDRHLLIVNPDTAPGSGARYPDSTFDQGRLARLVLSLEGTRVGSIDGEADHSTERRARERIR